MKTAKLTKAKGKKIFSFILTIVMVIGLLPQMAMPVFAEENTTLGFPGGNTTPVFPTEITVSTEDELNTAITNAAEGNIIKLGGGIAVASTVIISNKDIILDLNGQILSSSTGTIRLIGTASLEVKDSSADADGVLSSTGHNAAIDGASIGNIIISGGTVTSEGWGIVKVVHGNVTVSGGTVSGDVNAILNNGDGTVNVLSGEVSGIGDCNFVIKSSTGTVNVSGGTISSALLASIGCGVTNISGGMLDTVMATELNIWGDPTLTVRLDGLASGEVNITGALTGANGSIILDGNGLTTTTNGTAVATATDADDADVSKFALTNLDGKKLVKNGANIELDESVAATTIDTESKLRTAIANAAGGDTIKLGGDIAVGSSVNISNKDIILDLNGQTLSSSTDTIQLFGTASLEVKDSSAEADGILSSTGDNIAIFSMSTGSITISGGTVTAEGWGIVNRDIGNVTVSGGTVSGKNYAILNNGNGTVNVLSGEVSAIDGCVFVIGSSTGTVNVSGGKISSAVLASISCGVTNISGGILDTVRASELNISGNPTLTVSLIRLASKKVNITGALTGADGSIILDGNGITTTTNGTAVATATDADDADVLKFALTNLDGKKLVKNGANIELDEIVTISNWADGITNTTDTWDDGGNITTAEELAQFAYNVNHGKDYSGKTMTLSNDISLSGKEWTPIGIDQTHSFKGTFDGTGKKITGVKIGSSDTPNSTFSNVGLFGCLINGTSKNLGVYVEIYSSKNLGEVGGLVGASDDSTITNCYAAGKVTGGYNECVGGLIGVADNSTITNCYATGNVTGGIVAEVGGVVGFMYGGTITNCYATGNVTGGTANIVFGLVSSAGYNTITNCYWNSDAIHTSAGSLQDPKQGDDKDIAIGMTSKEMKAETFATKLNGNIASLPVIDDVPYKSWAIVSGENDGYPMFSPPLNGTIKDTNDNPVSGATVTITPNAGTLNPATTGNDGKYTIDNVPDGSYTITVTLPNSGGSFTKDITVPGDNFDIQQPTVQTYTVAYNGNEAQNGSVLAKTANVGTETTVSANKYIRTGYIFNDWNTAANGSGTVYAIGSAVPSQTAGTIVTLYAQWTVNSYSVSGTVHDDTNNPLSGARVRLVKGNTQIGAQDVTTTPDGNFTITGVLNGTYNLVVEKEGVIVTKEVVVNSVNHTLSDIIKMPKGKINSVVEVEANTPDIVVGNLDAQFESADIAHGKIANNAVEIKLVAEEKDAHDVQTDVNRIAAVASNKTVGLYLDLSVTKTITTDGVVDSTTQMATLPSIIEIIIPLPQELQGKDGLVVYRVHNGTATALPNGLVNAVDEEYFVVSGNFVTIYTKNFSTYAIGYTTSTTPNNHTGGSSGEGSASSVVVPAVTAELTITAEPSEGGKITISTDKKTATITPDEGYVIADVVVDSKSIGATEKVTFADNIPHKINTIFVEETELPYYNQNDEKVYVGFSVISGNIYKYIVPDGMKVEFNENSKNFTDNTIAWAKQSVDFVTDREIFFGTTEDMFSPNESMTRGMFVTVIGRLYERSYGNVSGTSTFSDVDSNDYYAKYVAWANENGIIKGIGENKFAPNEKVTREQMSVIMLNFANFLKKAEDTKGSLGYVDSASISTWAIDGAEYCQETKVIAGREGGNFAPQESATRAEVAAVIERFIKTIVEQ